MANGLGYYNALLGRLFDNGTELPLRGGLNFVGFDISQSAEGYTIEVNPSGGAAASDITNDSSATGATVKDALNSNLAAIAANTASIGATGATGAVAYNAGSGGPLTRSSWTTNGTTITFPGATSGSALPTGALVNVGYVAGSVSIIRGIASDAVSTIDLARYDASNNAMRWGNTSNITLSKQLAASGGSFVWSIGSNDVYSADNTQWNFSSRNLIGVANLNGARVCPPTQASLVSGSNAANMTTAANYFMAAGTTATASTVTCGATGAATGACLSFYVQAQSHNVTIADASGTTLRVVSAGEKEIVDVRWDTSTSKYANPSWKKAQ